MLAGGVGDGVGDIRRGIDQFQIVARRVARDDPLSIGRPVDAQIVAARLVAYTVVVTSVV